MEMEMEMKMKMRNSTWNDRRNLNTYPVKMNSYRGNFWCSLQRQNFANSNVQKEGRTKRCFTKDFFTSSLRSSTILSRKVTELLKFHNYFFNLTCPREVLQCTSSLFSFCQQDAHKHTQQLAYGYRRR